MYVISCILRKIYYIFLSSFCNRQTAYKIHPQSSVQFITDLFLWKLNTIQISNA